jgi:uncharacterized protein (TIGR01777 family)
MKLVVTGGTGFIGSALVRALVARGDNVVVLTREPAQSSEAKRETGSGMLELQAWEPTHEGPWQKHLDGADAVVHLAGEPLAGRRQTKASFEKARESRVRSAELLVEGMREASRPPRVFVSGSAVGYYGGDHGEEHLDEGSPPGTDALAQLCVAWEAAAEQATELGTRVVASRTGIVLGPGGGALPLMALPFRLFVGGPLGSGAQRVSWVHLDDSVSALLRAIDDEALVGPINVTAPKPVSNEELSRAIGRALGRPSWLRVPACALRLALADGAEPVLGGQHVVPKRLLDHGFVFRHPGVDEAVRSALGLQG